MCIFFFFKQKTAYEMRISDWSSDVCSSDLFQIGQHGERTGDFSLALRIYHDCSYPGARLRMIRVLERIGEYTQALEWGEAAAKAPQSAAETQALLRILPRLRRKLGGPPVPRIMARKIGRAHV